MNNNNPIDFKTNSNCCSSVYRKTLGFICVITFSLILSVNAYAQSSYYVRAGATGANNGFDWNNAFKELPVTLKRGAVYYIADGSYPGRTFSDSASGTSLITIKKATEQEHGTSIGWNSSYGDGQAVFGVISFKTNYWLFDGAKRNESDWSMESAYGFVVSGGAGGNNARLIDITSADNITIRYVFAYFNNIKNGQDINENRDHGLYSLSGSTNIIFEKCKLKNISWKAGILMNSTAGPIKIRYNFIENIWKKETFSARSTNNVTFASNYIKNAAGTGILVGDNCNNWDISCNYFSSPNSSYSFTDVTIGTWIGDHADRNETLNNWKIYNNRFYQIQGANRINIQKGTGNVVTNNRFIGFSSSIYGSLTATGNIHNAPLSEVVAIANGSWSCEGVGGQDTGINTPTGVIIKGYSSD